MCEKAKGYLSVAREYTREITMLIGFCMCWVVYSDNKAQTEHFMEHMQKMTAAMGDITIQLHDLEKKIELSNRKGQ